MPTRSDALQLFAVTPPGLEPVVAAELEALGIRAAVEPGGAAWTGTVDQLYGANLRLRTASRVLLRIGEFRARTFFELERHAAKLPWERLVSTGARVALRVTCKKSKLYHEGAVAERFQTAIARAAGAEGSQARSDDDELEGESGRQLFVIRFHYDRCTVSADTSGALLHLRGYRQAVAKAPLRETIAAAMLRASGWDPGAPLLDPLCGSGAIAIEAALLARNIAPGLAGTGGTVRSYAFHTWPEFDERLWRKAVEVAAAEQLAAAPAPIRASDRDAGAVEAARGNAERAGVLDDIDFSVRPLSAAEPPAGVGWIVSNPPYGVRVGEADTLRNLYAAIGRWARARAPGWTLALLTADRQLERQVGIPLAEALRTRNGGIPVRLGVGRVPS